MRRLTAALAMSTVIAPIILTIWAALALSSPRNPRSLSICRWGSGLEV